MNYEQIQLGVLDQKHRTTIKALSTSLSVAHGVADQSAWHWLLKVSLRGFGSYSGSNDIILYFSLPVSQTIVIRVY